MEIAEVDGAQGEGGGQVLRCAASLCQILARPLHISRIRHNRSTPGLAAQHLEGLELITRICRGTLDNAFVRSTEVTLRPGPRAAPERTYFADPGTAGAVTLMTQIALPGLVYDNLSSDQSELSAFPDKVTLKLSGGTNVSHSPPVDHLRFVLLPLLQRMGVRSEVHKVRRGYYPQGGGLLDVSVHPTHALQPLQLVERGEVKQVRLLVFGNAKMAAKRAALESAQQGLSATCGKPGQPSLVCELEEGPDPPSNLRAAFVGICITAFSSTGSVLYADDLIQCRASDSSANGSAAAARFAWLLASGACVDEHTADQLVLYMALAAMRPNPDYEPPIHKSVSPSYTSASASASATAHAHHVSDRRSRILVAPPSEVSSLHLQTVIDLTRRFTGADITVTESSGGCRLVEVSSPHV